MFRSIVYPVSLLLFADFGLAYADSRDTYASLDQSAILLENNDFLLQPVVQAPEQPPARVVRPVQQSKKTCQDAPVPAWQQDLNALRALPNADAEMLKAAYRIIRKQKKRRLVLLDYRFADTNGDGTYEVVTLAFAPDAHDRTRFVVSVYDFDENGEPVLRFEKKQKQTTPYEPGAFSQSIDVPETGFTLCENWRMQTWRIHECHDIRFDDAWNPGVLQHVVETTEISSNATQTNRFDFRYGMAGRSYTRIPDGPFMPALQRQTDYAMLFAPQNNDLPPEPVDLPTTQIPALSQHEAMRIGTAWNANGLYITMQMTDVDIVGPEACNDQLAIQQYDHAELWFDLNPALDIQAKSPESWQLEYQKAYHNAPYRHDVDADVFGIAITPGRCVVPMTPDRDHWQNMPQVATAPTAAGYKLNVFVPAAFFGVSSMTQLSRAQGLSFTARQHDRHADRPFDATASSAFEWPDPFTFGQIWLTTPDTVYPPPFPMQWDVWLDGGK